MPVDRRIGTKIEKSYRKEEAPATRIDPYPYIGIVKNNVDPTRCGRMQIWIPDLGGNQDDPQNWRTVSYASPFMGTTNVKSSSTQNSFDQSPQTYGMWMVPPDIGVEVIVIFIAGDLMRGYWIACTNTNLSRHMLPGMASSTRVDPTFASSPIKKGLIAGEQYPVTEFNPREAVDLVNFKNLPKPIHEEQFYILKNQGLDRDTTRGTITSSSQRETPSNVFGISTPGRPYKNDPAKDPLFNEKVKTGKLTQDDYAVSTRKGGHTFVMDDGGATNGIDQLIRLRTSAGHQILMHDSENSMYIANADGTVWIELGSAGQLDIFSQGGLNLRTQGSINMHADKNINMHAGGKFSVRAENKMQFDAAKFNVLTGSGGVHLQTTGKFECKSGGNFNVDAAGKISLNASGKIVLDAGAVSLVTDVGEKVMPISRIPVNSLPDTIQDSESGFYIVNPGKINSIVTIAPGHEPFYLRKQTLPTPEPDSPTIKLQDSYTGTNDAVKSVTGSGVTRQITEGDIRNQPIAEDAIGNLSKEQTTALLAQIAKSESGGKADPYSAKNTIGFVGKYQFGYEALQDLKYVKSSVSRNSQLSNPNSWTGKDGINSLEDYYAAHDTQEAMILEYTRSNYNTLVRIGTVTTADPPETVGGLLMASHLLGPGGARDWRQGKGGQDDYGTTGATYFQRGKYAVSQIGPQVAGINAG